MIFLALPATGEVYCQEELDVLRNQWLEYTDAPNSLYHYLSGRAVELLEKRTAEISEIKDPEQWVRRQNKIKETLKDLVGPFPEKSPLNARILRSVDKGKFRMEHLVFESQPGFYVTSTLYVPSGLRKREKAPAIVYCSGHSEDGYRSPVYQHVIQNLVLKGFIVFAFDPVGQGERLEYYDSQAGRSVVGGPTKEHSYPGAQAFIAGSSQAFYMIWDGIRAVDYLMTRREVDPARIGITGRSGGGTQSACIAAMDDRIYAAAPENYITNYTRLFQSIGPQDAEQNIFNLIIKGLDHPDFLIVRAPKPALMITTTRDMFSIQGARETSREVSEVYRSLGKEDFFSMVEDDAPHASTLKNREAMYAFFQRFLGNPGNSHDEITIPLTREELQVTPTGQVSTSFKGETVFSLNCRFAEIPAKNLSILRSDPSGYLTGVIKSAKRLSGYQEPRDAGNPVFTGRIQRTGYSIEKYFVRGEGNYVIPYLLFRPGNESGASMIYLNPQGKNQEANQDGEIEKIVRRGITVLAPDLLGTGEVGEGIFEGDANFDGASHNLWYASILIDHSIVGIQAADIVRLAKMLLKNNPEAEISGFARKELAPAMLHAAAFSKIFNSVFLVEPVVSYRSIITTRYYNPGLILSTVAGAYREYDLPDLEASLVPGKLLIVGPTDAKGMKNDKSIEEDLEIVRSAYTINNASANLVIISSDESVYEMIEGNAKKKF